MNKDQVARFIGDNFGITIHDAKQQISETLNSEIIDEKEYLETLTNYSGVMKSAGVTFEEFNALIMKFEVQEKTYPVYND